jgi:hypothetical protein
LALVALAAGAGWATYYYWYPSYVGIDVDLCISPYPDILQSETWEQYCYPSGPPWENCGYMYDPLDTEHPYWHAYIWKGTYVEWRPAAGRYVECTKCDWWFHDWTCCSYLDESDPNGQECCGNHVNVPLP